MATSMSDPFPGRSSGSPEETNDDSLKHVFDQGMKLFNSIQETTKESMDCDNIQYMIKSAISKFETSTKMVSYSGMFSKNESIDEVPTEHLQFLLLPVLLGTLTLQRATSDRRKLVDVAEIYFKDYLQRCKDYGITNIEIPEGESQTERQRQLTEQEKIAKLVLTREAKIKRYKEGKALKEKLSDLSKAMAMNTGDDEIKREYFMSMLQSYVNQAVDELASIEQEKPMLDYMAEHGPAKKPDDRKRVPLKPVIIARDAVQKAVLGAGYPAIPSLTIEEFYDQRVREGLFPGSCSNIPHTTIQSADTDASEAEEVRKEHLVESDDPEELARRRNMDEYKDDHRRGWGNRHNRS